MDYSAYDYIFAFPVTIPNTVWVVMILLLMSGYVSTYILKSQNVVARFLRFVLEYGKYKTIFSRLDVPKRFFTHYYIVASIWNVSCLYTVIGLCYGFVGNNWIADVFSLHATSYPKGDQLTVLLVLAMLTVHSIKRLCDCLFISVFSNRAKLNIIQYSWGFVYYIMLAPTLISECLPLKKLPFGTLRVDHVVGIIGFCFASYLQHRSHVILADLRKNNKTAGALLRAATFRSDREYYGVPKGNLFEYVSCPHYLAELLIYTFTLLMLGNQCISWWLVMGYNVIVHVNMAIGAHLWYLDTFRSYPKNRMALIPYLF